jgi:Zn-dependent metalloprotease
MKMKKITLLSIGFLLITFFAASQENTKKAINDFEKKSQAKISFNKNLKTPGFIKFPINNPLKLSGKNLEEKVTKFLIANKSIYAIVNVNKTLKDGISKTDNYGLKHYTVKQYYKDVPVYDSQLRFHFDKNENLRSINGNIIPGIKINSIPTLTKSNAGAIALNLVENQNLNQSGKPLKVITNELYIFPKGIVQGHVTSKHLAYRIEVRNDSDVREYLFIDAHTGKLVEQFTGIAHALNRSLYRETLEPGNKRYTEGGSTFFLTQWEKNEVETAGHTYYFFKNAFGIDSYDNAGAEMITINNNPDINCPNATWNGVSANYCDGTASDDVVAHEWGHAYTSYTSNLIYAYESGALSEAYSDFWGETIDLLNNYEDDGEDISLRTGGNVTLRWQVGEDATAFGAPIRDMWDPTLKGDPDKITSTNYWCAPEDNGGVHINSGIPNHAYALIVDGGTFNGQTITGLGFTKAAHIFWRTNSEYLTPTSDFSDFADGLEASCSDLIGINLEGLSTTATPVGLSGQIITASDYNQVVKALIAVELRTANNCTFAPLLAETDPLCEASLSNPIFFEDWESGIGTEWTIAQIPVNPGTWENREWIINNNLPKNRTGSSIYAPNPLNGDCDTDLQNGIIQLESPTITMPNYTTGTFDLAFNHNVATETDYDGGNIKYSLDGGVWTLLPASAFIYNAYNKTLNNTNNDNPMMGEDAFSGSDENSNDSVWGTSIIDLSSLGVVATSTIQLRWEFGSDGCNGNDGWYIDEIVVYNCAEALSINDFNFLNNNISISPNPSSGIFNIEMKSISDFRYDVYDITGKSVRNRIDIMNNSFKLDLSNYSPGIYFFKLYSNEGTITKKLMVK